MTELPEAKTPKEDVEKEKKKLKDQLKFLKQSHADALIKSQMKAKHTKVVEEK